MNAPFETELKFQVPVPSLAAVERSIATQTARTLALQARYWVRVVNSTPDAATIVPTATLTSASRSC